MCMLLAKQSKLTRRDDALKYAKEFASDPDKAEELIDRMIKHYIAILECDPTGFNFNAKVTTSDNTHNYKVEHC